MKTGKKTHGKTGTKEFNAWSAMIQRCCNSNHKFYYRYGGRGISIYAAWKDSFESFLNDVGVAPTKKHSLDRINNNGNYEPGNCRWALSIEQMRNTENSIWVEHNGEKKTLMDLSAECGVSYRTLYKRIFELGVPLSRALNKKHLLSRN